MIPVQIIAEADMAKNEEFNPALRFEWLTPFYGPILRWLMREDQFKKQSAKNPVPANLLVS